MVIVTRDFDYDQDTGFIIDTMPKAIYFDTHTNRGRPNKKWFEQFHTYLTALIKTAAIIVAVDADDANFILGYAMFSGDELEFIYVKDGYRKQGIATMLSRQRPYKTITKNNMTKLGQKIIDQMNQPKDEPMVEKTEPSICNPLPIGEDRYEDLCRSGIEIPFVRFQSAVLSGFNAAEFQFSRSSKNRMRIAESLHYTGLGVVVKQNGKRFIVPLTNIIQAGDEIT